MSSPATLTVSDLGEPDVSAERHCPKLGAVVRRVGAEPADRVRDPRDALLRVLPGARHLDRDLRRARLVVRRHRLAGAHRTANVRPADPDRRRDDRPDPHRAGHRQHLPLLPPADHQRRCARHAVPAVAGDRAADGGPPGRRLLPDGPRAVGATADPEALLAPDADVGGALPRQGADDPVAAAVDSRWRPSSSSRASPCSRSTPLADGVTIGAAVLVARKEGLLAPRGELALAV